MRRRSRVVASVVEVGLVAASEGEGHELPCAAAAAPLGWSLRRIGLRKLRRSNDARSAKVIERLGARRDVNAHRPDRLEPVSRHYG